MSRARARPGDSGDAHRELCVAAGQRAARHRPRHRLADRAMQAQVAGTYAEHLPLGGVRVGDESTIKPLA